MDFSLSGGHITPVTTTRSQIREDFSAAPVCPHCEEIQEIATRRVESNLGFWMG